MKKILLCAAFIAASFTSIAQVGIGTTTPDASAALDIESTTKGFLPPRMDTAARNAIVSPKAGLVIYNTSTNSLQWFNGTVFYDVLTQTTDGPPNSNLTVSNITYQGVSVIDATGIGYNGEAVPESSTITVDLTNTDASNAQGYGLSARDAAGSGLIYAATGTIDAGATNISVILRPNTVVMPAFEGGVLTMPLLGTSSTLDLLPRIDIKSIPASATQVTGVFYGDQIWMDRNLGARRVATAIDDVFSYGNHYQWGRPGNGHEIMVWNGTSRTAGRGLADTNANLAADDIPEHDNFIIGSDDWLVTPATAGTPTLWAIANQGPCPANYHVPTITEWSTADTAALGSGNGSNGNGSTGWDNYVEPFESALKLPCAGNRGAGLLWNVGSHGRYWSSSLNSTRANMMWLINNGAEVSHYPSRSDGMSVRCIKD